MKTKFDIKINWNQMLRDEIEKKINEENDTKINSNQKNKDQS
jgi:hypothetical protein